MCSVLTARREIVVAVEDADYRKKEDDAVLWSDVEVTSILNGYWQSDINNFSWQWTLQLASDVIFKMDPALNAV
jgi:hypothetical protein